MVIGASRLCCVEALTRSPVITGKELRVVHSTVVAGWIRSKLFMPDGAAIPGFIFHESEALLAGTMQMERGIHSAETWI